MKNGQGIEARNTMTTDAPRNIYEMYVANGNKAGFWVQRDGWEAHVAQVISISGETEGPLRGKPPYYGNPHVVMDLYDTWDRKLKAVGADLSCPGSDGYWLVDKPNWIA